MTDDNAAWRDEEKLPVSELSRAMATWDTDGQRDDQTGNDAGQEREPGSSGTGATDPYRADRPSTTGQTGPN